MIYLIDSNTFMTAARHFYSLDFCTQFWDFLKEQAEKGLLLSIDKVYNEINRGDDLLKNWVEKEFRRFFVATTNNNILSEYARLMKWGGNKDGHYAPNAINDFMKVDNADPWLIAYALTNPTNYKIVTFEKKNKEIKKKIPIPNVCEDFNVQYCDLFQLLKELNFKC